jgi:acyl carrier protein|tara:strand:- start:903 stop:1127 length:225 start_codon:yes stop_codon:yes gene_type:complete
MEKVVKAIAEHLDIDVSKVVPEASLIDDLGADDFDIVEMTIAIQNATGGTITSEQEANVKTVGDFIKLVENKNV